MGLDFTERQARTIAAAVTTVSTVVILLAIGVLGLAAALFLRAFSGVFLPLAVGAVGALVFRPYYDWLRVRLRLPVAAAVGAVFLSVLLPLSGFLWFFGQLLVGQLIGLAAHVPDWWESTRSWVAERLPQITEMLARTGLGDQIRSAAQSQQEAITQGLQTLGAQAFSAGLGVARGVGTLLGWVILPVYFAYFLTTKGLRIDPAHLPFFKAETRNDVVYLGNEFLDIIVAFFRGQLIVAFLQGMLFAIGFQIAGLKFGFVLGLLLGLLNIIPYLGSIVGLGIALPLAFFQDGGGLATLAWVLGVFTIVQLIESYFLTPKIMGDKTGLHPMAIIVAIFFWGAALGGVLGMILAIPLTAFLASFWRLVRDKYIPEII